MPERCRQDFDGALPSGWLDCALTQADGQRVRVQGLRHVPGVLLGRLNEDGPLPGGGGLAAPVSSTLCRVGTESGP